MPHRFRLVGGGDADLPPLPNLSAVLTQSPLFVAVYDLAGLLVWTNRVGYGFRLEDVQGKTIAEIVPPGTDFVSWHFAYRAALLGNATGFSIRMETPEHPPGFALFVGRMGPLRDYEGRVSHVIVTSWDTTTDFERGGAPTERKPEVPLLPDERRILEILRKDGPLKGGAIGARLRATTTGGQATNRLRVLLSLMLERGLLTHDSSGYHAANLGQ